MRKKVLSIFLLLVIVAAVFAADMEALLMRAKENSSVYQGYELNYQNTLIEQRMTDLNEVLISVNSGYQYSSGNSYLESTDLNISIPDLYDDIQLTFGTALSSVNLSNYIPLGSNSSYSVTPSLTVSKDFKVKSFTDTREEMEDLITDLQTEVNYMTNVINFENEVMNAVVSIMKAKTQLQDSETSYNRSVADYENGLKLGSIEAGSLNDIKQKMNLDSLKLNLDSMKVSYNKSLADFRNRYGIDYETVTEVRDADLTFFPEEDGNSTVMISYYNWLSALQDLEAERGNTSVLTLEGSASSKLTLNNGAEAFSSVDAKAGLTYSSDSWSIKTTLEDSFGKGLSMVPKVSVSGSWVSSTAKSETDSLKEQKLYNEVLKSESNYNNALYEYTNSVQTLQRDIDTHLNDVEQLNIQTDYHKTILDYQTRLYEMGLAAERDVVDAQTDYDNDLSQAVILKLQALILENKIKTIEL